MTDADRDTSNDDRIIAELRRWRAAAPSRDTLVLGGEELDALLAAAAERDALKTPTLNTRNDWPPTSEPQYIMLCVVCNGALRAMSDLPAIGWEHVAPFAGHPAIPTRAKLHYPRS